MASVAFSAVLAFQLVILVLSLNIPSSPSSNNAVDANFFGISFELSFMNEYFGNDTSTIPQPMLNYLGEIRSRTGPQGIRIRVGGNSGDISSYMPSQTSPMLILTDPEANANNQPVNYGPMLWEVMDKVSQEVGGVQYLIGLTINSTNTDSVISSDATKILGTSLDAMILGNEPDLYTSSSCRAHGQRPNVQNYTVQDYIGEYSAAVQDLSNTSAGDLVNGHSVAGPSICCSWDLATLLQQGYLTAFTNVLKYITLQHYPQNNCFGTYKYDLVYYTQHGNVVDLAAWQKPGIDIVASNTSATAPRMLMSEFNSASCGGIPNISDTFAVGSMWSIDYALQLASIGYTAAYIHTREQGISYNVVTPPNISQIDSGSWTTNPPFYGLVCTSEILASSNGSIVTDLNVSSDSVQFTLPSGLNASNPKNTLVKYLSASSITEKRYLGATDGKPVSANTSSGWAYANQNIDCSNGCNITAPGPSLAVIFLDSFAASNSSNNTSSGSPGASNSNGAIGQRPIFLGFLGLMAFGRLFI
ncbi:hypothetical protein BT96DRAFT_962470 [Gymnopus androsaceus JB14]|uniref:Beta-glucuronidase C-terminal domain-containing protein n=1 Tax=Gymnopus androsaceus JB14 TaxID=1447944 RepID=A0A6A4ILP4_9AGAR|nr:hypothetical protein BT96DRAFT_962470 [Gymnopus androsaceus JB14]